MSAEYPPAPKPAMKIEKLSEGRYKVQSRTDPDIAYLVKYWAARNVWTCSCPWGTLGAERTGQDCAHVKAIEKCAATYEKYLVHGLHCSRELGHSGVHTASYSPNRKNPPEIVNWK